jgi:hypothetical protein
VTTEVYVGGGLHGGPSGQVSTFVRSMLLWLREVSTAKRAGGDRRRAVTVFSESLAVLATGPTYVSAITFAEASNS